ncbi:hypothetical protein [Lacinutrix sp. Hel_I_90]|uniref:hypothetical protein n=1 Tax=Lacinutrix sp. Hel_I_90 TaxID=1249999 RepID=UPI0005C82242|nr:hypothetical protein [Lacinutrix sp. Hel_I_90]
MKKPKSTLLKTSLFITFLVTTVTFTKAQENNKENLEIFDKIIGPENTKLYNGKRYYNLYKSTLNNHNFFKQPNYQKGDVFYDGQYFINVDLKYDLFVDKLIFKPVGEKSYLNIELIKNKIDSFSFQNHKFINSAILQENEDFLSGFLEVIYTSPLMQLYAKRRKTVSERIKQTRLTYTFYTEDLYFLSYNSILYEINSSKDFGKIFLTLRKEIKKTSKENKERFRNNDEDLYLYLITFINFRLNTNKAN